MSNELFINGLIAVKEKSLLGERLRRLCEGSADDAFRALVESGFGAGADAESGNDYELLIAAEERAIDAFVREFAPSRAIEGYLLYPRDFHNARAAVKAEFLSVSADKLFAPDGTIPVSKIVSAVQSGTKIGFEELDGAIEKAVALFREEETRPSGVAVGAIFEQAMFAAMQNACKKLSPYDRAVSKFLTARADMTNILTAMRSPDLDYAKPLFLKGSLKERELALLFGDAEKAERAFLGTPYAEFYNLCSEAKRAGLPFTAAEQKLARYDLTDLNKRRFELKAGETFLYYVLRKRLECDDVRILFVCLNAGLSDSAIKERLRSTREGT